MSPATEDNIERVVKYAKWGWAIVAFVAIATATATTKVVINDQRLNEIDRYGTTFGREWLDKQEGRDTEQRARDEEQSRLLNKIAAKLGVE